MIDKQLREFCLKNPRHFLQDIDPKVQISVWFSLCNLKRERYEDLVDADFVVLSAFLNTIEKIRHGGVRSDAACAYAKSVLVSKMGDLAEKQRNGRRREKVYHMRTHSPPARSHEDDLMLREVVETALAQLPPEEAFAVQLNFMEGIPLRQVAEFLGVSLDTAHRRLTNGRNKLRALLKHKDFLLVLQVGGALMAIAASLSGTPMNGTLAASGPVPLPTSPPAEQTHQKPSSQESLSQILTSLWQDVTKWLAHMTRRPLHRAIHFTGNVLAALVRLGSSL